ncbi:MAG: hypothetical protein MR693_03120 [Bacteroidales bacterium]|nr:hypothetical protein [Bacteroidales bacterium]
MKRLFTLMGVLLLTLIGGGSTLQAKIVLTETQLSAADITALNAPKKIAIRAVQNGAYNEYLTGSNTRTAFSETTCVFIVEPIGNGDFYLKLANPSNEQGEGYLQTTTTLTYGSKASAQVLHAVLPSDTGSDETKCDYVNIWDAADKSLLVRFVKGATGTNGGYFNVNFNDFRAGTGVWSYFLVHEVLDVTTHNVTMNFYNEDGTTLLGSTTTELPEGYAPTVSLPSYVEIANNPFEGQVVTGSTSYDVYTRIKASAPFQVSTSTDDATAHWFGMKLRDAGTLWIYDGGDGLVRTRSINYTLNTVTAYQWCLTGDWFNGFTITNRSNKRHMADIGTKNPGNANYAAIKTVDGTEAEGTHVFKLVMPAEGKYGFLYQGETNKYLSNKGGTKNEYLSEYSWDGGGNITFVSMDDNDIVSTYKNGLYSKQGFVGGYTAEDLAGLDGLSTVAECQAFDDELATKTPIAFDAARYYRIKNYARNLSIDNDEHIGHGGYMGIYYANPGAPISCHNESLGEAASIWKFEKDADSENYRLYNLNAKKYVGKSNANGSRYFTMVADAADAGLFSLTAQDNALQYVIACTNGAGDAVQLHVSGYGVMNYNAGANSASAWYLAPAEALELNLNAAGADYWASLYLPFDVTLPASVEAYAAKSHGTDYVGLTPVIGTLAAEDGVVIKAADAKVSLPILTTSAAKTTGNLFRGTLESADITDNKSIYTLGASDGVVALYHPSNTKLKANRAYLPASAQTLAASLRFVFGDDVTGIDGVEAEQQDAKACYDLSGRRVLQPKHGLYVIGNKKVLIP